LDDYTHTLSIFPAPNLKKSFDESSIRGFGPHPLFPLKEEITSLVILTSRAAVNVELNNLIQA
jgi:hypothetical protein